jgi:hypothetical protein
LNLQVFCTARTSDRCFVYEAFAESPSAIQRQVRGITQLPGFFAHRTAKVFSPAKKRGEILVFQTRNGAIQFRKERGTNSAPSIQ